MAEHVKLKITGTLKRIPAGDADSPEFVAWCEANGVHPLGGGEYGRRGWWGAYNTYIGNSDYVFYTDSGALLLTQAELDEMLIT